MQDILTAICIVSLLVFLFANILILKKCWYLQSAMIELSIALCSPLLLVRWHFNISYQEV